MKRTDILLFLLFILMLAIAACSPQVVEVEITRVVVETVEVQATPEVETIVETEVEVVETEVEVIEEVEEVEEEEMADEVEESAEEMIDDPSATGIKDGDGSPHDPGSDTKVVDETDDTPSEGWIDISGEEYEPVYSEGEERSAEVGAVAEVAMADDMIMEEAVAESSEVSVELDAGAPAPAIAEESADAIAQVNSLTAGDVDDNAEWDDYIAYRNAYAGPSIIDVDVSIRHQIFVQDSTGAPVLGAVIRVNGPDGPVATLRTHSDGRAYFFPLAYDHNRENAEFEYSIDIVAGSQSDNIVIPAGTSQREWIVDFPAEATRDDAPNLDILFLIDTTGSMGDEIQQLKDNIRFIAETIDAFPDAPDVRFAMTVYKDRGDEYVSRTFEFTPEVEFFASGLADVYASGGGDYPEDLNEGLYKAVNVPEWRVEETISLIFVVADAPPQLVYEDQPYTYASEMQEAARRGIKIYPIASSGLDEQGEYIFRQMAQYTGGRFLFLTYGAAGAGSTGGETDLNVDDYDVTSLDGLVLKIVEEELSYRDR